MAVEILRWAAVREVSCIRERRQMAASLARVAAMPATDRRPVNQCPPLCVKAKVRQRLLRDMTQNASGSDRRKSPRTWLRRPGQLVLVRGLRGTSTLPCKVINTSKGGALIQVEGVGRRRSRRFLSHHRRPVGPEVHLFRRQARQAPPGRALHCPARLRGARFDVLFVGRPFSAKSYPDRRPGASCARLKARRKCSHCLDRQWPPYSGMAEHQADSRHGLGERERQGSQWGDPDRRPQQVVRRLPRPQEHQSRRAQGREDRHLRTVRLGQIHPDPLHQPAGNAPGRPHRRRRNGADQRPAPDRQGARRGRHGVPELQPVSAPHRAGQPLPGAGVGEENAARGGRGGWPASIWSGCASPSRPTSIRGSFPAASSSASPSRGPCA